MSEGRNRKKYVNKEIHNICEFENRLMRSHPYTKKYMMDIRKDTLRKKTSVSTECTARESITCSISLQSYSKNTRRIMMNLEFVNSDSDRKERTRLITRPNLGLKFIHLTSSKSQQTQNN